MYILEYICSLNDYALLQIVFKDNESYFISKIALCSAQSMENDRRVQRGVEPRP